MSRQAKRSGGKYTGTHTSLIAAAARVTDIAHELPYVEKISPGIIKSGLRTLKGNKRVKISVQETHILLQIRENISVQEVRLYGHELHDVADALAHHLQAAGFHVTRG